MLWLNLGRAWPAALALLVGLPAFAEVDKALLQDGWGEVLFDGKTANRFAPDDSGGVTVSSAGSVSLLQRPLSIDIGKTPMLTWRWSVDQAAPSTDLSTKGEDDRSLALYVAFPFVPEEAGVMERMKRAIVENVAGEEAPGRVLMYVWGGEGERGDRVPSPYLGDSGIMTILRPADTETGRWFSEQVDIAEDYRQSFGSEPPDPMTIAIGADTDDTGSLVLGRITDLVFIERSPGS